ncbi:uncharacterized protein PV06_05070 [Exophiala oligosperma]|uniref:Xylanolytic transcriptional activator regulatory domain-containing protein n=1 Tax=Exophiala oligosperma TaxID=215243 RepID=A0A0D2C2Q4_9EURO|nr:uncharacterized protein PV06_05070 [Exophiala oligosperma]KIW44027.1 hypothetical protein PV06_05070 [Exophiala oligosperma]
MPATKGQMRRAETSVWAVRESQFGTAIMQLRGNCQQRKAPERERVSSLSRPIQARNGLSSPSIYLTTDSLFVITRYIASLERQLAEHQQSISILRTQQQPQDASGSAADLAESEQGQRIDTPTANFSIRSHTHDDAQDPAPPNFAGSPTEAITMPDQPFTQTPNTHNRMRSVAPSQHSTLHSGQTHARESDLYHDQRSVQGHDSEQGHHASSPVDAMGTAIRGGSFRCDPTDEYYGQSSVVSLMKEVSQHQGSDSQPAFVDDRLSRPTRTRQYAPWSRSTLNETDFARLMLQPRFSLPPRSMAEKLLDIYFQNVQIFYPLVHSTSFLKEVDRLWQSHEQHRDDDDDDTYLPDIGLGGPNCQPTVFFCALNAMFALGCEFSDLPSDEKAAAALVYTERMKDLLQIPILDSGNLAYVQALLLAGQHLHCTQYPTQCWNVVGLACRMALGLGLHCENGNENGGISLETEIKRRVWYGCVQMDMHVSMTLGRPPTLHNVNVLPLPRPIDDVYLVPGTRSCEQPEGHMAVTAFNVENLKLAKLLGNILEKIYHTASSQSSPGPWLNENPAPSAVHRDISAIMHMDSCLKQFADNLPEALRWDGNASILSEGDSVLQRQRNVLQARFIHLKVLLHRPSFSAHRFWLHQKRRRGNHQASQSRHETSLSQTTGLELVIATRGRCAVACVENACDLILSISNATAINATGAWWWSLFYITTAAIILILAESCEELVRDLDRDTMRLAWEHGTRTLERISHSRSVAADHLLALRNFRSRALAAQDKVTVDDDNEARINSIANFAGTQQRQQQHAASVNSNQPTNGSFLWPPGDYDRGSLGPDQHHQNQTAMGVDGGNEDNNFDNNDMAATTASAAGGAGGQQQGWLFDNDDDDNRFDAANMACLRPFTDWDFTLENMVWPSPDNNMWNYSDVNTVPYLF